MRTTVLAIAAMLVSASVVAAQEECIEYDTCARCVCDSEQQWVDDWCDGTQRVCDTEQVTVEDWCDGTTQVCDTETVTVEDWCDGSQRVCDTAEVWVEERCQGTTRVCDTASRWVEDHCQGTTEVCDTASRWVDDHCQASRRVCDTGQSWVNDYCQGSNWVCDTGSTWVTDYCEGRQTVCDWERVCEERCDDSGCWTECTDVPVNCREETYSYACGGHWESYEYNCRSEPYTYVCGGHWQSYEYNCRDEAYSYVCGGHWESYETNVRDEPYECVCGGQWQTVETNCREEPYRYVCGSHEETRQVNCRDEPTRYVCGSHEETREVNCREEPTRYICGGHWETVETNCREEEYACNPHPCPPPPPAPCRYAVSPATVDVGAGGGSSSVTVVTGADCAWTAVSGSDFIQVLEGSAGSGPGTVTLAVPAHAGSEARTGVLTVAGVVVTVTQAAGSGPAPCSYAVSPASVSVGSAAASGSISVSAGAQCAWTAVSGSTFIRVTGGADGTGEGTVTFDVDANPGSDARSGVLTIAGVTVTVTQAAAASSCEFSVNVPYSEGPDTGVMEVTAPTSCDWSASADVPWVTLNQTAGSGSATIGYSIDSASLSDSSVGHISIGGQSLTVGSPAAVGSGTFCIDVPVRCPGSEFPVPLCSIRWCFQPPRPPQPPPANPQISIQEASLDPNGVVVRLSGGTTTQTLSIALWGNGIRIFVSQPVGNGTHTFQFSDEFLASLPPGQYTKVRAAWYGKTAERQLSFRVLGRYRHSQYNTPHEQDQTCGGEPVDVQLYTAACESSAGTLRSVFNNEVYENGSGYSINYGVVQLEGFCHAEQRGHYRRDGAILGVGGRRVDATTVAALLPGGGRQDGVRLDDRILIVGVGVKTVTDRCPRCALAQFDNYTLDPRCADVGDLGNFNTILLR